MARALRIAMVVFGILYALALALFLIGLFGLFGQERDPLSAVFLLPLGLPWNLLAGGMPGPLAAWGIAFAPWLNIALLWLIYRYAAARR